METTAALDPPRSTARRGDRLFLDLQVANGGEREEFLRASLVPPPGWAVAPNEIEVSILSGQQGVVTFGVTVPPDALGPSVLRAEVTLGDHRLSPRPEATVDIVA